MSDEPNPPGRTRDDITRRTVQGGAWLYGQKLTVGLIHLAAVAILARQLTPAQFGIVALAQVLLRFLTVLGSGGFGDYIIYDRKEGRSERVYAAFWLNQVVALGTALLAVALVPLAVRFYEEPDLAPLLLVLVVKYLLDQISIVPDALIKRDLDYQKLVVRDTALQLGSATLSVAMALAGFGVWSLVVPQVVIAPVRAAAVMLMARWRPSLPFRVGLWREVFRYSRHVVGANLANTVAAEGDTLLIGRLLGNEALGLYNMAWQTANLVSRHVTSVVSGLAMPSLSSVAEDMARLRAGLKRMLRILSIISFPLLIGLFVVADDFVLAVYGDQWTESIVLLRILIIYAIRRAVGSPATVIYNVVGRPDIGFKFGLAFIPIYLIGIVLGSLYGVVGVAVAVTLIRTGFGLVQFQITAALVGENLKGLVRPLMPALISSLLMGSFVFAAKLLLASMVDLSHFASLITLILIGGAAYLLLLRTAYQSLAKDLIELLGSLSKPASLRLERLFGVA
ncbi:MAG: lipopolysaccharide biosynthesis protein [Anaerolineales bacterium]|nr:lipopolysaccharide biosynthesis protein [Anaerolineales bacterium]